ncbi:MAG TPA: division/cell wall cluster transcriptional repressor MraZ [Verrucomicrobiae bacterium]|nr:division/cell wall cluster transcriptional repressor MraZ [Verrucomicrobiae bacterium]
MVKALTRTVFVGTFRHSVDEKNRVAIPAKWRAAAKGSQEFYVLPDPKSCLVVLPASAMEKMLDRADDISIGEYERRDVLRVIASRAHGTPCDSQGRIALTNDLLKHAGIDGDAVLIGALNKFEIWSPARWAEFDRNAMQNFSEAAKQLGL